jgi:hypothetical protein
MLCYHIEIGPNVLERTIPRAMLRQTRAIYCSKRCHHDLRGLTVMALRREFGCHGDRLCEYTTTTDLQGLKMHIVGDSVCLLRCLSGANVGAALRSTTIRINRFASVGGSLVDHDCKPESMNQIQTRPPLREALVRIE